MLSAYDMHKISSKLCRILGVKHKPFGGLNMIFAGDFAQLPPIQGKNASLYGRKIGEDSSAKRSQEQAIGKSLWHQVTTVVILRENMRQRQQKNLWYNACTQKDIAFLESRASVSDDVFRNVSVITSWNVHKDEANRLGSIHFVNETKDSLRQVEKLHTDENANERWNKRKLIHLKTITDEFQHAFWDQPPSSTDLKIPGKLSLCVGMPVMIRRNSATELGMTKGQESTVYAWQSCKGLRGQRMLDTLFVLLQNPPSPVQFDGLPLNVVPIVPSKARVCVNLPGNKCTVITREQVEVLPNFAMTDYAAQGKTCPFNVVDLHKCKSHQSLYTCLSRSASAAGTIILQGMSEGMRSKITKGASGALRQEFRELELLDEITAL
ncbi:hypothetical protein ARMSODRAFT_991100 [Armillaria solidipes]|uniref:ATP-dependent DNA helicase n=1 Tax=Armillaria solidipes TaxID=1076256 RepID=A0A2H3ASA3_9AGAR|nr:hypothetical protein ARMSODRAFT_991100 [Armillaria solidipes]